MFQVGFLHDNSGWQVEFGRNGPGRRVDFGVILFGGRVSFLRNGPGGQIDFGVILWDGR